MRGEKKNTDWKAAQKMMIDPGKFLDQASSMGTPLLVRLCLFVVPGSINESCAGIKTSGGPKNKRLSLHLTPDRIHIVTSLFRFAPQVRAFDAENMTEETVNEIMPIIKQPFFNFEVMKGKSQAASFLCNWVVNIVTYNTIYRKVKPLMDRFAEATESKNKADANLALVMERVREINGGG